MNKVLLEKKYALQYIKDVLNSIKEKPIIIDSKYHHNTGYECLSSVCINGILTMNELSKLNIKNYTEEVLKTMSDIDSHVNGIDNVSLAVMGLNDLYPDEEEYNPFIETHLVDILISNDIKTFRSSLNYGNEYLHQGSISKDKIRAIDIRLLKLIKSIEENTYSNLDIKDITQKYNYLKEAATLIKGLDIYLREMSFEDNTKINIDKLIKQPTIILK